MGFDGAFRLSEAVPPKDVMLVLKMSERMELGGKELQGLSHHLSEDIAHVQMKN